MLFISKNNAQKKVIEHIRDKRKIKQLRIGMLALIIAIILILIFFSLNYQKSDNHDCEKCQESISGKGDLEISLRYYPKSINATNKSPLVLVITITNIGNNSVRIFPPQYPYTIGLISS